MTIGARSSARLFITLSLGAALLGAASPVGGAPILENYDASLTTFLAGGSTGVQDIAPVHLQRGTGLDGSVRAGSAFPWMMSGNPMPSSGVASFGSVRLDTGGYATLAVDIALPASVPFPIGRTFNGAQVVSSSHHDSDGYMGRNWMQTAQPELTLFQGTTDDLDVLYLVYGADRFLEFKRQGTAGDAFNTFKGVNGAAGAVLYVPGSPDTYVYHDGRGMRTYFFGGNTASGRADWQLWKVVDPAGNAAFVGDATTASTAVTNGYNADGTMAVAYDSADRRLSFTYSTIDSVSRLTQVTAETKSGGTWASPTGVAEVARASYAYYATGDNTYGDNGCLKLVTVRSALTDSGSSLSSGIYAERKTHYRYGKGSYNATTNPYHPNLITYIVEAEGYRRADWAGDTTFNDSPLAMTESNIKPYASTYFEYDANHRVRATWAGGQCGCAGAPDGLHQITYEPDGSGGWTSGYDARWHSRAVIEPPGGAAWSTQYVDEVGQPMSRVSTEDDPGVTPGSTWAHVVERDSAGAVARRISPAAVATYTHATGGFTTTSTTNLANPQTTIGGAGDDDGLPGQQQFSQGTDSGQTRYMESATAYNVTDGTLTVGSIDIVRALVASRRIYPEVTTEALSGTFGLTMTHAYTMHAGAAAMMPKQITTTPPAVTTGNNGSNTANPTNRYLRADGTTAFNESADGIFTYTQHTQGQVVKVIQDANTDMSGDFAGGDAPLSDFGIAEVDAGERIITTYTYDPLGRPDTTTLYVGHAAERTSKNYYSRLADGRLVTISIPRVTTGGSTTYYGPASYSVTNLAGRAEFSATVAFSGSGGSTTSALSAVLDEADSDPITALDVGTITRLATTIHDDAGVRVVESRSYFSIPGSGAGNSTDHYDPTLYGYDDLGRRTRVKDATGTITRMQFDALGRTAARWTGDNDNGWTGPGGESSGTDNMVKIEVLEYDSNGVGNGHLTKRTTDPDGNWGTTGDQRVTEFLHDFRGRTIVVKNPQAPHTVSKVDNMSRVVATGLYRSHSGLTVTTDPTSTATDRIGLSQSFYDELGRVWKSQRHNIDQSDGSDDDSLASFHWFDEAGRLVKTDGEQLTKTAYDRLGRATAQYVLATTDDSAYADAKTVTGDIVLEQSQTGYEAVTGRALLRATIARHPGDKGGGQTTGSLDSNADTDPLKITAANITGRVSISATWYDAWGRATDTVALGTNGIVGDGSTSSGTYDRGAASSPPTRSDTELVTTTTYDTDGTVLEVTDAKGLKTRYLYDDAGRRTAVIANYVNGTPSGATGDDDIYTRFIFDRGRQVKYWMDTDGDGVEDADEQVTQYVYGVVKGTSPGESAIASGHLLATVIYPDTESGEVQADHSVSYAYNALGEQVWMEDQSGNILETVFDSGGRAIHRRVTTLAGGFDGAVRRVSTTYSPRGQVELVTQWDDEDPGTGSAVNEVAFEHDGWGLLAHLKQDRNSEVGDGTPDDYGVLYSYVKAGSGSGGGRNTLRREYQRLNHAGTGIEIVYYDYLSSSDLFDDAASRVSRVTHNAVTVAGYDYLGMSQVTGIHHPEPGVFRRHDSGTLGVYPDLDQFGRLTASRWTRDLTTDIDFVANTLSYDRNSGITWSEDEVYPGRDVKYTMDGLNRLIDAEEGTRSSGSITSRTRREEWSLQQVGNWDLFKLDLNGDGDQGDAGELADKGTFKTSGGTGFNELRFRDTNNDASNDVTRVYDKNGNLTDDGVAYTFEYDAFNRLRKIKNRSNSALVEEYTYNGLGHRVGWHYDVDADGTVESNSDDPWFYFAYDESWRMLATFRADDTEPKEFFINHQAGLGGMSLALGLDATILRDKDANSSWASAYDVREERIYYCQDLRNGRADVLCLVYDDGTRAESVRYSPYGVPFGIHYADLDGDGTKTAADQAILTAAMSTSVGDPGYTVVADLNLDGEVDSADQTLYTNAAGVTLGRGALSRVKVANRKGYAGYEHDGVLHTLAHVRHRVYEIERGRWVQRDPLGFVDGGSVYGYVRGMPVIGVDVMGLEAYIGGVGNYTGPGLGTIWSVDRHCIWSGGPCLGADPGKGGGGGPPQTPGKGDKPPIDRITCDEAKQLLDPALEQGMTQACGREIEIECGNCNGCAGFDTRRNKIIVCMENDGLTRCGRDQMRRGINEEAIHAMQWCDVANGRSPIPPDWDKGPGGVGPPVPVLTCELALCMEFSAKCNNPHMPAENAMCWNDPRRLCRLVCLHNSPAACGANFGHPNLTACAAACENMSNACRNWRPW